MTTRRLRGPSGQHPHLSSQPPSDQSHPPSTGCHAAGDWSNKGRCSTLVTSCSISVGSGTMSPPRASTTTVTVCRGHTGHPQYSRTMSAASSSRSSACSSASPAIPGRRRSRSRSSTRLATRYSPPVLAALLAGVRDLFATRLLFGRTLFGSAFSMCSDDSFIVPVVLSSRSTSYSASFAITSPHSRGAWPRVPGPKPSTPPGTSGTAGDERDLAERRRLVHRQQDPRLSADRHPVLHEVVLVGVGHVDRHAAFTQQLATSRERTHQHRPLRDRAGDDRALTPHAGPHRQPGVAVGAGE